MKKIILILINSFFLISPLFGQKCKDDKDAVALIQQLYAEPWKQLRWGYENKDPIEREVYYRRFFSKAIVEALVFHVKHINNKNIEISDTLCRTDIRYYPDTTDITNKTIKLYKMTNKHARVRVKYGVIDVQKTEFILIDEDGKWKIDDQLMDGWFTGNPATQEGNRLKSIRYLLEK